MSKQPEGEKKLTAWDFKLIAESLPYRLGRSYTEEYIRKVYLGRRRNKDIENEIMHYQKMKEEFETRLKSPPSKPPKE